MLLEALLISCSYTGWHEIFAGVNFYGYAIFSVLRLLIFVIRADWFFLLRINFCDFQKVPDSAVIIISFSY